MTYWLGGFRKQCVWDLELREERAEAGSGEFPLEGASRLRVVVLETKQAILYLFKRLEVIGCEHLSLNDREVDLYLIEPTRVDGGVDHDNVRPSCPQAIMTPLAAVGCAVVEDPEHTGRGTVGLLAHDLLD